MMPAAARRGTEESAATRREAAPGSDGAPASGAAPSRGETIPPGRENVYGHRKRFAFIAAQLRRRQEARRATGAGAPLRVLDVGCGTGVMITRPLARLGHDVTGLDLDPVSIRQATRLNTGPALANLTYVTGRLEDQRWAAAFDVVVCSEVLEHVRDPDAFLDSVLRLLKPDGILLLTVPNGYGLFELDSHLWEGLNRIPGFWRLVAAWNRVKGATLVLFGRGVAARAAAEAEDRPENVASLNENSPHCQRFTRGRVVRLLERHGLRLDAWGKSAVWSGPIAHTLLRDCGPAIRLNCALADRMPAFLTSGHYFCVSRATTAGDAPRDAR